MNAKGKNKYEPFVMIRKDIYLSPSFQDLSPIAVRVFLEIRRRYNGFNNGEISLSCREAAAVAHCGSATAQKALSELQKHGFIKIAKKGLFSYRLATTWILTYEPLSNCSPTNEWRNWPSKTEYSICHKTLSVPGETVNGYSSPGIMPTVSPQTL